MHRTRILALVVVCSPVLVGLFERDAAGSQRRTPVVHPTTCTSPSGEYALHIDPTDIHGRFGAWYCFSRNGQELWSDDKPYTLWGAAVTDDGIVAGYGYTHGEGGIIAVGAGYGKFHVVIIRPDGDYILNVPFPREHHWYGRFAPDPVAKGLILDPENDRLIVRIHNQDDDWARDQPEYWWVFRLSTGAWITRYKPRELMANAYNWMRILDGKPIPGTPFILLHWECWARDEQKNLLGSRFALVDPAGRPVWVQDSEDYFSAAYADVSRRPLAKWVRESSAILATARPGRFDLLDLPDGKRVSFSVGRDDAEQWVVRELSRTDFVQPEEPKSVEVPQRPLAYLGPLVLETHDVQEESSIRDIRDFDFDGRGRICFLRWKEEEPPAIVVVEPTGEIIREIALDDIDRPNKAVWGFTQVTGDRFIVIRNTYGHEDTTSAWWLDVSTGELAPIEGFPVTTDCMQGGFPDGGFVSLGTLGLDGVERSGLHAFDAHGKHLWTVTPPRKWTPGGFDHPDDVAVTRNGFIVAVSYTGKAYLFDRAGKHVATFDLEKKWVPKPDYPTAVAADSDGGFIIRDSFRKPPIVRMRADGSVRDELHPRHPDGRTFAMNVGVKAGPDGRLWTTDGDSLLRLTEEGVVDRVLGSVPNPDRLGRPANIAVGRQGQIYAVADRTGAVHVFAADGNFLHVCRTAPTDFNRDVGYTPLTVTHDGYVYLKREDYTSEDLDIQYVRFGPDGTRLGLQPAASDWLRGAWYSQPGTGNLWVVGYQEVSLVNPEYELICAIARRPDRRWLESLGTACVAPDGSIAVEAAETDLMGLSEPGTLTVSIYTPMGEPERMIRLPASLGRYVGLAYDGNHLVVAGHTEIVVFDASGIPLLKFTPPSRRQRKRPWRPFILPGGRELLLFDGKTTTLQRYALP